MSKDNVVDAGYGYKMVDGKIEVVEEDADKIRQVFDKFIEYTEHPPKELVESVIQNSYESCGEVLTYEKAEEKVPLYLIYEYISKEVGVIVQPKGQIINAREVYECGDMLKLLKEKYPHSPIIERETFEKAQEHMQKM